MGKKILITGITGFLGKRVAAHFRERYELLMPAHEELDITNQSWVEQYFHQHRPDVVIHCAAVSDIGVCEQNPESSRLINVTGSENIARAAKTIGAKCILCSSDQVYTGGCQRTPHEEEEVLSPVNGYGRQKAEAEQNCLRLNPDCILLRLTWMYDPVDRGDRPRGDFVRILTEGIQKKQKLVFSDQDYRGITSAMEVARNMEHLFELPGGIYNFGSPNEKSVYETAKEVLERLDLDTELVIAKEDVPAIPRNLVMSQEKLNGYGLSFASTVEGVCQALELSLAFSDNID